MVEPRDPCIGPVVRRLVLATAWMASACAVDNKAFGDGAGTGVGTSTTGASPGNADSGVADGVASTSQGEPTATAGSGGIGGTDGDSASGGDGDTAPMIPAGAPCDRIGGAPDILGCWDFDELQGPAIVDDGPHQLPLDFGGADIALTEEAFWGTALDAVPGNLGTAIGIPASNSWTVEVWFSGRAAWPASLALVSLLDSSGSEVMALKLESIVGGAMAVGRFDGIQTVVDLDAGPGRHRCAALVFTGGSESNVLYLRDPAAMGQSRPVASMNPNNDLGDHTLVLETGALSIIDGLRIWGREVREPCDPAPPP